MSDIFISYSHQDRDRARDLAERLKQEGWSVFWDRVTPVGKTWDEILEKELYDTKVIIVLWSVNSVKSEWVRAEATNAASRKILVPATLESVTIPIRFQLLQTADISSWKFGEPDTEEMRSLIEAVTNIGNLMTRQEVERIAKEQSELKPKQEEERIEREQVELKQKQEEERLSKKQAKAQRKQKEEDEHKEIITEPHGKTESIFWRQIILKYKKYIIIGISIITILLGTFWIFRNNMNEVTSANKETVTEESRPVIKSLITDIEGNKYNTITIGNQVWMAENLRTTRYIDGTAIPLVTDNSAWENLTTPGYCWYNNDRAKYEAVYGALYNWYAVNTGKLCPLGWHVPSDAEWKILTTFLGGVDVAGGKMKEAGTSYWNSPNTGATNKSGFSGLPGGSRNSDGNFSYIGYYGYWWSSTERSAASALDRVLDYSGAKIDRSNDGEVYGFSVRCLRDF